MPLQSTIRILSDDDIERLLEKAFALNETVGVAVRNGRLREVLLDHGAQEENGRIKLSRRLIQDALQMAPSHFPVSNRNGGSLTMEQGSLHLGTMSDAIEMLDLETQKVRSATVRDLSELTILADALPEVDFIALQVVPSETQGYLSQLNAMEVLLKNTAKPLFLEPVDAFLTRMWVELEHLLQRTLSNYTSPSIVMVITTLSPLQFDEDSAEKLMLAANSKIPILTAPCPIAGMTSPFTLAGSLVQSLAETLFELTAAQVVQKGCPVFFGAASTVMDVRTGTITYGAPEYTLLIMAYAQIAAHFNLPSYCPITHPDAGEVDVQMGAEMMLGYMGLLSQKPTIMPGIGALSKTGVASAEKVVIDAELFRMAQRVYRGIDTSDRHMAYQSIAALEQGETYLTDPLTIQELRSGEHFIPKILNREQRGTGTRNMQERAREELRAIMGSHQPEIDKAVTNAVGDFFDEKRRQFEPYTERHKL